MIIDCHVHCKGGDLYRREFSAVEILRTMDEAGVDRSVVFPICLPSVESQLLTQGVCAEDPARLIPFAHVLPEEGALASVELGRAIGELGFRGLKLHLGELTPGAETPAVIDLLSPLTTRCADLGVPCLIDVGGRFDVAVGLAEASPDCNLIIAHLGCSQGELTIDRFIGLAATTHNVFLDTSYNHNSWKIGEAIRRAGAHKIIWGSDGPLIHPAVELKKLEVLGLSEEEWTAVTSANILRLLGHLDT
ncbi:MAG: amidohydrolase family protein [Candidatus Zipacnadales bacterium]